MQVCAENVKPVCENKNEKECRNQYKTLCSTNREARDVLDDVAECTTEMKKKCKEQFSGYFSFQKCKNQPARSCTIVKKMVRKYIEVTSCRKDLVRICIPKKCKRKSNQNLCEEKVVTFVQNVPKEECYLEPVRSCVVISRRQPKLSREKKCSKVPKENCLQTEEI